MDPKQILKQMMEFNKYTFENAYHGLAIVQSQAEQLASAMINHADWLPEDGKKAFKAWSEAYKKGAEDFKKRVDASFGMMEELFEKSK
jgi:phage-related minor tail protein